MAVVQHQLLQQTDTRVLNAARYFETGDSAYMVNSCAFNLSASAQRLPDDFIREINSLHRPPDWDDEGAPAIGEEACEAAMKFVRRLRENNEQLPLPWPAPSILGAVSLYWRDGDRHLLVRIFDSNRSRVFYQIEGPGNYRQRGTEPFQQVLDRALQFFAA